MKELINNIIKDIDNANKEIKEKEKNLSSYIINGFNDIIKSGDCGYVARDFLNSKTCIGFIIENNELSIIDSQSNYRGENIVLNKINAKNYNTKYFNEILHIINNPENYYQITKRDFDNIKNLSLNQFRKYFNKFNNEEIKIYTLYKKDGSDSVLPLHDININLIFRYENLCKYINENYISKQKLKYICVRKNDSGFEFVYSSNDIFKNYDNVITFEDLDKHIDNFKSKIIKVEGVDYIKNEKMLEELDNYFYIAISEYQDLKMFLSIHSNFNSKNDILE